jgi:hypothetical protein
MSLFCFIFPPSFSAFTFLEEQVACFSFTLCCCPMLPEQVGLVIRFLILLVDSDRCSHGKSPYLEERVDAAFLDHLSWLDSSSRSSLRCSIVKLKVWLCSTPLSNQTAVIEAGPGPFVWNVLLRVVVDSGEKPSVVQ